jgi:hypothetical protein
MKNMPSWLWMYWKSGIERAKRVPAWLWGAVLGGVMMVAMFLRMRAAEKHADASEAITVRAKLKAKVAKSDATIAVELEKIDALAKERTEIREVTSDQIEAIHDMDDQELSAWLREDAKRRAKLRAKK